MCRQSVTHYTVVNHWANFMDTENRQGEPQTVFRRVCC